MANIPATQGGGAASPRIEDIEPITMRARYQLPWNRKSNQTACGQTIQTSMGDLNWRVTIEGIITLPQLSRLRQLRDQERVEIVTEEFGLQTVRFDQFNIERQDDADDMRGPGDYQGPLLHFQLQTKEDSDEEGIEFFNDNTRGSSN